MSGARLAFELARWAAGFVLLWRMPRPAGDAIDRGTSAEPARVHASVVVPARDEARNLQALLPTLVPQVAEVLVVDDGSSDGTASVARGLGATVLDAGEPPEGWAGKPWACHVGAAAARHDVLVFVDADVVVEPRGIARAVAEQRRRGGLVSLQPWHDVVRPYEHLSLFPNLVAVMGVGAFTVLGERVHPRGAFGPCLVIDRESYRRAGGHAAVRGEVIEDVALARRVEHVTLLGGQGVARYRMYPDGVRSLVEGWTKNLASGARAAHPVVLVLVVVWLSGAIQAPFTHPALYVLFAVQIAWLARSVGRFGPVTALLYPVGLAFFLAVFVRSAFATFLTGRVAWRGRTVVTR